MLTWHATSLEMSGSLIVWAGRSVTDNVTRWVTITSQHYLGVHSHSLTQSSSFPMEHKACQISFSIKAILGQAIPVHSRSLPCFLHLCLSCPISGYPEVCLCPSSQMEPMPVLRMDGGPSSCKVHGQAIFSTSSSTLGWYH